MIRTANYEGESLADELADRWSADFGTSAPGFGDDSISGYLEELGACAFPEALEWARLIVGRALLPSEIRRIQEAGGYLPFVDREKKRTAVLRRAGNGLERTVSVAKRGHSVEDLAAWRDTGRDPLEHRQGNWERVNGIRPGMNRHNVRLRQGAELRRHRLFRYCEASFLRAPKSGAAFSLKEVFAAGSRRIFGRSAPYANRSRVRELREWIGAEIARKNVTHPARVALSKAPGALGYGSTEPTKDIQKLTHLPGTAGAPGEVENLSGAPDARTDFGGEGEFAGDRAKGCRPSNPEGRCPSRLAPGPIPCSVKARAISPALVGLASSAIPTLREAHKGHDRISWGDDATNGRQAQRHWAKGWLVAWLAKGRGADDLVRIYLEQLAAHDYRARESGFGRGQFMPWGLRKQLQVLSERLPAYSAEHFAANPARFAPTKTQLELVKVRAERRALRDQVKRERIRRKSAATVARLVREHLPEVSPAIAPEKARQETTAAASESPEQKRAKYLAAHRAALLEGDWAKCRRIMIIAESNGVKL